MAASLKGMFWLQLSVKHAEQMQIYGLQDFQEKILRAEHGETRVRRVPGGKASVLYNNVMSC